MEHHKYETLVPCTLKCRICDVTLKTKKMYKQHQKEVHAETVNIEEKDVVELVPKQDDVVELIPIDDFKDWDVLSGANEELTMSENNGDLIMEYTYKRTVVIRSQVLKDLLKTNTVKRAMQALEFKNDN